jgi:hypothetical protein
VTACSFNVNGQTNVPPGLTKIIAIAACQYQSVGLLGAGPPKRQALLGNPSLGSNVFNLSLPTQRGRVYSLEYKNSPSESNWTLLPLAPGKRSHQCAGSMPPQPTRRGPIVCKAGNEAIND